LSGGEIDDFSRTSIDTKLVHAVVFGDLGCGKEGCCGRCYLYKAVPKFLIFETMRATACLRRVTAQSPRLYEWLEASPAAVQVMVEKRSLNPAVMVSEAGEDDVCIMDHIVRSTEIISEMKKPRMQEEVAWRFELMRRRPPQVFGMQCERGGDGL
jgi:hypothetical protein